MKNKSKRKSERETNQKTIIPKRKDEEKEYKKEKDNKQQNGKKRKEGKIEKEQTEKTANIALRKSTPEGKFVCRGGGCGNTCEQLQCV